LDDYLSLEVAALSRVVEEGERVRRKFEKPLVCCVAARVERWFVAEI